MRILISSNGPHTPTGYGQQTKGLAYGFRHLGHDVAVFSWYGLMGGTINIGDGITVFPALKQRYGGDVAEVAKHWDADVVLTLQDIWVLPDRLEERMERPWICYFPIDGEPLSPVVRERAENASYPVAYSKFGVSVAEQAGLLVDYIPHAIDTGIYRPGLKEDARKKHGIPNDAFLVSMVAANQGQPSRKAFPEAIEAFRNFRRNHPDDPILLYMHTEHIPTDGVHFGILLEQLGMENDPAVQFVDQRSYKMGLPVEYVAEVYRASDVLLNPSTGEGFGLPILEAQATGTPVITQDATSMSELTRNGCAVPQGKPFYTGIGTWQYRPYVHDIQAALEHIYDRWRAPNEADAANTRQTIEWIQANYSWKHVINEHWKPFLKRVEAKL